MTRRIIYLFIAGFFLVTGTSAQNPNVERLNAYKIGFITKRLNLTPQEAEKFWPEYNEYQEMKYKIQRERQDINKNFNQNENIMSDQEMVKAAERIIDLQVNEATLAKEFHDKVKAILSPYKVLRLYQAENQYRMQLLKELQERKQLKN